MNLAPPAGPSSTGLDIALAEATLTAQQLVIFLPFAIAVVLAARMVIGVSTVGTFAPALLGLMVLQLGWAGTASALLVAGGATAIALPLIDGLRLSPSSRLTVVVSTIVLALVGVGLADGSGSALPIIVLAILFERIDEQLRAEGGAAALRSLASTLVVAAASALTIVAVSPAFAETPPVVVAAVGVAANLAVGCYRGLRLTELRRFAAHLRRSDRIVATR